MLREVAPGLWFWQAPHPAWKPGAEPDSPADWPELVGCVAYAPPERLVVLVDPQVPEELVPELDALVDGRPVAVLTTMRFHGRSRAAVAERYGAALISHAAPHPAGVARIPIEGMDESMVWLEAPRALIPGDRLLGDGAGGLRPCPPSWLGYLPGPPGEEELRAALAPLLELPAELVLTSHGEPVLRDGAAAIRAALRA